jgi:hypothetical protein
MFKGRADVPMGEFHSFSTKTFAQPDVKEAASAAHLYGQNIAVTESFTGPDDFRKDPFALKALGDRAFCTGSNQFYLHVFTHKPDERKPGPIMSTLWGVGFNRHQTWWPMARAYFDYLTRCQSLLRGGRFHGDLLYFYGEGAPSFAWGEESAHDGHCSMLRPAVPRGYDYDWCNAELLLTRLSVRDGQLVTPEGTSYRVLILPEPLAVTPPLLGRLAELIRDGATVIGPKPTASPSLAAAAAADTEVRELADAVWGVGAAAASAPIVRHYGKGRIISGVAMKQMPLAKILADDKLPPDFDFSGGAKDLELLFIHRTAAGRDLYFLSNQSDQTQQVRATFRVNGRRPVLLDPVTGEARDLPQYETTDDGRTALPLQLEPRQSLFVEFDRESAGGKPAAGRNFPLPRVVYALAGAWDVHFDPTWGGPRNTTFAKLDSWTSHAEPGIRHYSGIAVYRKQFDVPGLSARSPRGRYFLDLGSVANVARVTLNGRQLGTAWTTPWRVAIPAGRLRDQGNDLEIEVADLWINRLQLDRTLPEQQRLTWTNANRLALGGKDLLPAGLLGPVKIVVE